MEAVATMVANYGCRRGKVVVEEEVEVVDVGFWWWRWALMTIISGGYEGEDGHGRGSGNLWWWSW